MDQVQTRTDSLQAEVIERERAEAAMREQAARIQAILDAAVDAIITIDEKGTVELLNPSAERLFGYTAAEVIGQNVNLLMPEPYHSEHDGYLNNYRATGQKKIIGIGREVIGRRKNGTTFPMHLAVSELWLGDRHMFTGIARDITDLKMAVRQLSDSESRTQAILNTAVDAIITINPNGEIESFNKAAEKMFGHSATDMIGKNVNILMPSPYHEAHDQYLRNYLESGIAKIIGIGREVVGMRADGTTFPLELSVSEVRLGDRLLFTGIVRDISALKHALRQLEEGNAELAARGREIQKYNLDLRRSNEELSQFAYVASHDLQEPLRKVTAFCQALQEDYNDKLDDTARGYIQYAVEGARRMKSLVVDLLSYSRVQSQGKPLEPTDANEACDEAIQNLAAAIEDAKAEVIRTDLPAVDADRAQLVRLFQNLIGNAIKYRGKEVPRIQIDAEELCDECLFRVSDNGIGIDPQYHERIFVIFQRLHAREQYSGTGIGLAVCKRIVERAGGRIWVESAAGAGSVFCFTLTKSHDLERIGAMPHDRSDQQLIEAID